MKIEISEQTEVALHNVKDSVIMMNNGNIYLIEDYKVKHEFVEVKHMFSKSTAEIKRYVTDLKIVGWNLVNKCPTETTESGCRMLLDQFDLYKLRNRATDMFEVLESFGFTITRGVKEEEK